MSIYSIMREGDLNMYYSGCIMLLNGDELVHVDGISGSGESASVQVSNNDGGKTVRMDELEPYFCPTAVLERSREGVTVQVVPSSRSYKRSMRIGNFRGVQASMEALVRGECKTFEQAIAQLESRRDAVFGNFKFYISRISGLKHPVIHYLNNPIAYLDGDTVKVRPDCPDTVKQRLIKEVGGFNVD